MFVSSAGQCQQSLTQYDMEIDPLRQHKVGESMSDQVSVLHHKDIQPKIGGNKKQVVSYSAYVRTQVEETSWFENWCMSTTNISSYI